MLHLFVALRPEASAFVRAWSLRRDPQVSSFDVYEGELTAKADHPAMPVCLVRSGIGKAQMAASVGWLAGRSERLGRGDSAIWLNAGVAGHGSAKVGDVVLAHRVVDSSSGRVSYPPLVVEPPCTTCDLRTVDVPETQYTDAEETAFDMEGAAFVDAARRFVTAELVHSLKVVSDGPDAPIHTLNRHRIAELSEALVPVVEELARRLVPVLHEVRTAEGDPPDYRELLAAHHFTVSDRIQLRKQLRRRAALAPRQPLPEGAWTAGRARKRIRSYGAGSTRRLPDETGRKECVVKISAVYVEDDVHDHPRTREILARLPKVPHVPCSSWSEVFNRRAQNFRLQKRRPGLILARKQDGHVLPTPEGYGIARDAAGASNYYVSHLLNCPYDCRYCFLQGMYRSAHYVLFVNYESFFDSVETKVAERGASWFFSGYDADSLALEGLTGFAAAALDAFRQVDGAHLELRTKSTLIRPLLRPRPLPAGRRRMELHAANGLRPGGAWRSKCRTTHRGHPTGCRERLERWTAIRPCPRLRELRRYLSRALRSSLRRRPRGQDSLR